MKIRDIWENKGQTDTICCEEDTSLLIASQILHQSQIGALAVVGDNDHLVGIVSERDIVKSIAERSGNFFCTNVKSVMSVDLITCSLGEQAKTTYTKLKNNNIRHIPIVENEDLVGMLSIRDFDVMN